MKSAYRKDNFQVDEFSITSNGFLNISGIVTRSGIFKYDDGNELRPADEVFKTDSLKTMFAVPVTWEHPPDLLDSNTVSLYQKGFVASEPTVEKSDDGHGLIKLKNIIVQDKSLIHEIVEKGLRQFSLGYTCDLDEKPGRFDNQDYIRSQKNIVYNHLAVVKDARCGDVCSIIPKEDSMSIKGGYKADCACQKKVKKDALGPATEKFKVAGKAYEDGEGEMEEGTEEGAASQATPAYAKELMKQHAAILDCLGKHSEMLDALHGMMGSKEDSEDEESAKEAKNPKIKAGASEAAQKVDDDSDEGEDDDMEMDEEEESMEDKKKKEKMKKKDSASELLRDFSFSKTNKNTSSSHKRYDRNSFLNDMIKGVK